jgi:hypothetical protein
MCPKRLPEPANAGPQAGGRRASTARSGRAREELRHRSERSRYNLLGEVRLWLLRYSSGRPRVLEANCNDLDGSKAKNDKDYPDQLCLRQSHPFHKIERLIQHCPKARIANNW